MTFINRVRFIAVSAGLGDFVVSSAVSGCIVPESAYAQDGKDYFYVAKSADGTQYEYGNGIYTYSTHTLARTTIFSTSSQNAKVNFSAAPTVDVFPSPTSRLEDYVAPVVLDTRNYLLNGAMMLSQENGTTAGTTTLYYPVDQFLSSFTNGGTCSVAQVASATPAGSPNRLRYTVTSADASVAAGDFAQIIQRVEGLRVAGLLYGTASAKTMTLRFGVKAPAGTYCVVFINSATNRSYVAQYVIASGEANTDVVKSVTIPGDTSGTWLKDTGIGLEVRWGLMAGSTFQQAAGSWGTGNAVGSSSQFNFMGTNGNVFELFDAGLYEGDTPPLFAVPDVTTELPRVQRYFWVETVTNILYAENISAGVGGNNIAMTVKYPVAMRIVPTVTFPAATSAGIGGVGFNATSVHEVSLFALSSVAAGSRMFFQITAPFKCNARL